MKRVGVEDCRLDCHRGGTRTEMVGREGRTVESLGGREHSAQSGGLRDELAQVERRMWRERGSAERGGLDNSSVRVA
ncbi:hypothetical protein HNY73_016609 [Argiope bruennichi]|uniref:Uncharacterized protein n=1 Tax=Argiope bruennichi TaxID=94029 RepID=A0A8T0EMV2_ARGBR|nr:hypothetical protein HNY73_016609 [Argiope bruennichi]